MVVYKMSLLKSMEFIPGVKTLESEMENTLFAHSLFGSIVFLLVSNTQVLASIKMMIKQVLGPRGDPSGISAHLLNALLFGFIMYFSSSLFLSPLLEGASWEHDPAKKKKKPFNPRPIKKNPIKKTILGHLNVPKAKAQVA